MCAQLVTPPQLYIYCTPEYIHTVIAGTAPEPIPGFQYYHMLCDKMLCGKILRGEMLSGEMMLRAEMLCGQRIRGQQNALWQNVMLRNVTW